MKLPKSIEHPRKTFQAARLTSEPLTIESVRNSIAALLVEPGVIGDHDDLIRQGLDSLGIMRLANAWRRSGVELKFAELIGRPTVSEWWRLISSRGPADQRLSVKAANVEESAPFDLALMQQAYWIGASKEQVLGGVSAQYYVEFDGYSIESDRLERAVRSLLERHAMLRVRFLPAEMRQQIQPESPWKRLTVRDLSRLPDEAVADNLQQLRRTLSCRRMAIDKGEVIDLSLTQLPNGATRLHFNIEMLVCDARSFQIVLDDLAQLYQHPDSALPPIQYSFQRYLAERAQRGAEARQRAQVFWQERLTEFPGPPQLPLAVDLACLAEQFVGRRFEWMPPEVRRVLAKSASQHGLTLPAIFATAFTEVLGAWSAGPRFVLNLPVFDREEFHPDAKLLVGDFTNIILADVDTRGNLAFVDRAKQLQARLIESLSHADYSGLEVLRDLARAQPGQMMAPIVFTSAIGMGDLFSAEVRRCFGAPGWTVSSTPQVWLDHQVTERDGGLLLNWDVLEGLFPQGMVDAMFTSYHELLKWLYDPDSNWAAVPPPLLPKAQQELRTSINTLQSAFSGGSLHRAFFDRAAEDPGRIALLWGEDGRMSYGALAQRALSIAAFLREGGVALGDRVAITMPRCPLQIASVLGVLAAGAVFVPVGIDQPVCRRTQIYENSQARVVLTCLAEADSLEWPADIRLLPVETIPGSDVSTVALFPDDSSAAYIIYTSGSTGAPKGVVLQHGAVMNTIEEVNRRFGLVAEDRVLAVSSLDFDLSIFDIFGLLSVGGALVILAEDIKREARRWVELARRWKVTVWNSVPAVLDMLLSTVESPSGFGLRLALVSGDWIGLDLPGRLREICPDSRFVALGGATEAAIWSNAFEVDRVDPSWRSIPYGFPLRNQKFRVVDHRGRDCPDWVPGEVWIGGRGVAAGYHGEPELTADRFVEYGGERWYRTGDLGCYHPDGALEFLGRIDLQIKIRGHRIELGEIEAVFEKHPQVARAVATSAGGDRGHIGVAVIPQEGWPSEAELRAFAADRLAPYMVPAQVLILESLPLSANGKVDRKLLATLLASAPTPREDDLPAGPSEIQMAGLWADLLGIQNVARGHSFFALGGDSLLATRLLEMIRKSFGIELSLRQLLQTPTLADVSLLVSQLSAEIEEGVI